MVVEMVPLKGGIGSIVHPPIGRKNATYIPLIVLAFVWGLYNPYHPLQESEKSTDTRMSCWKLGSMVRINGLFHLLINGVYWGYNPLTNH